MFSSAAPTAITVREYAETLASGPGNSPDTTIASSVDNTITGAAGTEVELVCTAVGGNPAPRLTWWVGGAEVPSTLAQEDRRGSGDAANSTWTSRARLRLPVSRADHAAQVRCEAEHDALNTPLVGLATLNILYSPRVMANIQQQGSASSNSSSSLREGEAVTLTCEVDSNPAAGRVSWRRSGAAAILTGQANFTISPVTRDTAGSYECVAENSLGISQPATVQLNVDCKYIFKYII